MAGRNYKTRSETAIIQAALDPGLPEAPGPDMLEGLPVAVSDRRQEPKAEPAIAEDAPLAGPFLAVTSGEAAEIELPEVTPVINEKEYFKNNQKPMQVKAVSDKEIVAAHLNDLSSDLLRITQGPPNVIRKVLGKQTIAVDLYRLFQNLDYTLNQCLEMVVLRDQFMETVAVLTLPAGKMTNRIQLKLSSLGFKSYKSDNSVIIKSPNAAF